MSDSKPVPVPQPVPLPDPLHEPLPEPLPEPATEQEAPPAHDEEPLPTFEPPEPEVTLLPEPWPVQHDTSSRSHSTLRLAW